MYRFKPTVSPWPSGNVIKPSDFWCPHSKTQNHFRGGQAGADFAKKVRHQLDTGLYHIQCQGWWAVWTKCPTGISHPWKICHLESWLAAFERCHLPARPGWGKEGAFPAPSTGEEVIVITFSLMDPPKLKDSAENGWQAKSWWRSPSVFILLEYLVIFVNVGGNIACRLWESGRDLNVGSAVWPGESYLTTLSLRFPIFLHPYV